MPCWSGRVDPIPPLGRITNKNYLVSDRGKKFAVRLAGTLIAIGEGWLYLMWVVAFVFLLPAISRIRQVAEHAAMPDLYDLDPRNSTAR